MKLRKPHLIVILLQEKGNVDLAIHYYLIAVKVYICCFISCVPFRDFLILNRSLVSFISVLQLRPSFCDAWSNLGSAYMRKGRLNETAECCRQALALNPRLVNISIFFFFWTISLWWTHFLSSYLSQVDAHSNLGNLMKARGLPHEVSIRCRCFIWCHCLPLYCYFFAASIRVVMES